MNELRRAQLLGIARRYGTPVYVYDAEILRRQFNSLRHFDRVRFAQKACSNIHVLRLLRELGAYVDCVSPGELQRALAAGFAPGTERAEIVYTADLLTPTTLEELVALRVPINAGSEDMLQQVGERAPGYPVWIRINPGFGHGHSHKTNTGGESSKHGVWYEHLTKALERVDRYRLDLVGFHMHIGSGADIDHLGRVCDAMVAAVLTTGRDLQAISGGGGLTVPYQPGDVAVDTGSYFERWDGARKRIESVLGHPVELEIEPGRYLTAQAGVLLTEVRATKSAGRNHFALVDAGFNDLMRPSMYGAHHEIDVLHSTLAPSRARPTVVAGPLCESGDVFTQRPGGELAPCSLPDVAVGDILMLRDAGAYGASMSSNYNSRPLIAEVLIDGDSVRLIRRRQRIEELLTLELEVEHSPVT